MASRRSLSSRLFIPTVLLFGLLLSGCAKNAKQDTLEPDSQVGRDILSVFLHSFWVAVVVFVIVEFALFWAIWKYRAGRRSADDRDPVQTHGNTKLEIILTIIPAITLIILGVPSTKLIFQLDKRPTDALKVEVIAHRFWWEFHYPAQEGIPEDIYTANELHVPVGKAIDIDLTGTDVIHSFWFPRLNGKRDVIPGHPTHIHLQTEEVKEYWGQCAEFCGLSHANMRMRLVSQSPNDFETWVQDQTAEAVEPSSEDAKAGQELFKSETLGCFGCHTIKGVSNGRIGPDLTHLMSRNTFAGSVYDMSEVNLADWLRDPTKEKPGSVMPNLNLSEDDISNLVAYLTTLK